MARIKLDPSTDTAQGRLDQFNDFSSPISKRVAHVAARGAKAAGLTRSTIAQGAGIAGVLDNASDLAKTDATNSVQAKIAEASNLTALETAQLEASSRLAVQKAADSASAERLAAELESREGLAEEQRNLDLTISTNQLESSENIATADRDAANDRADLAATVQREEIASLEDRSELDRQNSLLIQQMDDETQTRINDAKLEYQESKDQQDRSDSAWNSLQQGIASIDTNAKPESQQTQFNRLMDTFDARMGFLNAVAPPSSPPPPGNGAVDVGYFQNRITNGGRSTTGSTTFGRVGLNGG